MPEKIEGRKLSQEQEEKQKLCTLSEVMREIIDDAKESKSHGFLNSWSYERSGPHGVEVKGDPAQRLQTMLETAFFSSPKEKSSYDREIVYHHKVTRYGEELGGKVPIEGKNVSGFRVLEVESSKLGGTLLEIGWDQDYGGQDTEGYRATVRLGGNGELEILDGPKSGYSRIIEIEHKEAE